LNRNVTKTDAAISC